MSTWGFYLHNVSSNCLFTHLHHVLQVQQQNRYTGSVRRIWSSSSDIITHTHTHTRTDARTQSQSGPPSLPPLPPSLAVSEQVWTASNKGSWLSCSLLQDVISKNVNSLLTVRECCAKHDTKPSGFDVFGSISSFTRSRSHIGCNFSLFFPEAGCQMWGCGLCASHSV